MSLGSCGDCFFWLPEPEGCAPNAKACCLVEGKDTCRGHYCDFWEALVRRNPETGEAWPELEAPLIRKWPLI